MAEMTVIMIGCYFSQSSADYCGLILWICVGPIY